jgi:hypothetical protein
MIDSLKPGQKIRCTVLKLPKAAADRKTIERLMRRDPIVTRGLRNSHKKRQETTVTYNRGNRDWVQRQKVGKIVRLVTGNSWTCSFDMSIAPDFKAVSSFLKIEAA